MPKGPAEGESPLLDEAARESFSVERKEAVEEKRRVAEGFYDELVSFDSLSESEKEDLRGQIEDVGWASLLVGPKGQEIETRIGKDQLTLLEIYIRIHSYYSGHPKEYREDLDNLEGTKDLPVQYLGQEIYQPVSREDLGWYKLFRQIRHERAVFDRLANTSGEEIHHLEEQLKNNRQGTINVEGEDLTVSRALLDKFKEQQREGGRYYGQARERIEADVEKYAPGSSQIKYGQQIRGTDRTADQSLLKTKLEPEQSFGLSEADRAVLFDKFALADRQYWDELEKLTKNGGSTVINIGPGQDIAVNWKIIKQFKEEEGREGSRYHTLARERIRGDIDNLLRENPSRQEVPRAVEQTRDQAHRVEKKPVSKPKKQGSEGLSAKEYMIGKLEDVLENYFATQQVSPFYFEGNIKGEFHKFEIDERDWKKYLKRVRTERKSLVPPPFLKADIAHMEAERKTREASTKEKSVPSISRVVPPVVPESVFRPGGLMNAVVRSWPGRMLSNLGESVTRIFVDKPIIFWQQNGIEAHANRVTELGKKVEKEQREIAYLEQKLGKVAKDSRQFDTIERALRNARQKAVRFETEKEQMAERRQEYQSRINDRITNLSYRLQDRITPHEERLSRSGVAIATAKGIIATAEEKIVLNTNQIRALRVVLKRKDLARSEKKDLKALLAQAEQELWDYKKKLTGARKDLWWEQDKSRRLEEKLDPWRNKISDYRRLINPISRKEEKTSPSRWSEAAFDAAFPAPENDRQAADVKPVVETETPRETEEVGEKREGVVENEPQLSIQEYYDQWQQNKFALEIQQSRWQEIFGKDWRHRLSLAEIEQRMNQWIDHELPPSTNRMKQEMKRMMGVQRQKLTEAKL